MGHATSSGRTAAGGDLAAAEAEMTRARDEWMRAVGQGFLANVNDDGTMNTEAGREGAEAYNREAEARRAYDEARERVERLRNRRR